MENNKKKVLSFFFVIFNFASLVLFYLYYFRKHDENNIANLTCLHQLNQLDYKEKVKLVLKKVKLTLFMAKATLYLKLECPFHFDKRKILLFVNGYFYRCRCK